MRPGFFNDNANRAYPLVFCPGQMLRSCDGLLVDLPDSAIVDFGAIMGLDSQYVEDEHDVYLYAVCRIGDVFYFEFRSTAPGAFGWSLQFRRALGDEVYTTEQVESIDAGLACAAVLDLLAWLGESNDSFDYWSMESLDSDDFWMLESNDSLGAEEPSESSASSESSESSESSASSESSTASDDCPDEPVWEGYLVTGPLDDLAALIPPGCSLITPDNNTVVEPSRVQSLVKHYVRTLNLANDDRTRADAPDGCPELEYPFQTDMTYVQRECLVGDIRIKAGYNAVIFQDSFENSITIAAGVGAGEGEPCAEVPLFPEETTANGKTTLDGASKCNEVLRSINGVGGRILSLIGGPGVTITENPGASQIVIDIDMGGLAVCYSDEAPVFGSDDGEGGYFGGDYWASLYWDPDYWG